MNNILKKLETYDIFDVEHYDYGMYPYILITIESPEGKHESYRVEGSREEVFTFNYPDEISHIKDVARRSHRIQMRDCDEMIQEAIPDNIDKEDLTAYCINNVNKWVKNY